MIADDARQWLDALLGPDWEEVFIRGGAIAGPEATDEEVVAAAQRAVALAVERKPHMTDEARQLVYDAWFTLWVDAPLEEPEGGDTSTL